MEFENVSGLEIEPCSSCGMVKQKGTSCWKCGTHTYPVEEPTNPNVEKTEKHIYPF